MLRQRSEWADLQPDGVTDVGGFCILAAHFRKERTRKNGAPSFMSDLKLEGNGSPSEVAVEKTRFQYLSGQSPH